MFRRLLIVGFALWTAGLLAAAAGGLIPWWTAIGVPLLQAAVLWWLAATASRRTG